MIVATYMIETIKIMHNKIKSSKPVILNFTNLVTMDFMANSLLALGAAPIMSVCKNETEELIKIADAININIGTLDENFIKNTTKAIKFAQKYNKPIILDPVGAGATNIRTKTAQIYAQSSTIIRGNASEIIALGSTINNTIGVETANNVSEAKNIAVNLAQKYKSTVVVSGPVDFITDGTNKIEIPYGSHLMPLVTGMGCTHAAIIAAFKAVSDDSFKASVVATQYYTLCAELAEKDSSLPGSFRTNLINKIYAADFNSMKLMVKI